MKKHSGKVLSLVLALALVVSSFSSTFASAAVNTAAEAKVATATLARTSDILIKQTVAGDAALALVTLPGVAAGAVTYTDANGKVYTNAAVGGTITDVKIKDWTTSGTSATQPVTTDSGATYKVHAVQNLTGITTYTAKITAKVHLTENTAIDVTATAAYAVEVVAKDEYEIGTTAPTGEGHRPALALTGLAVNAGTQAVALYKSEAGTTAPAYAPVAGTLALYKPYNTAKYAKANATAGVPADADVKLATAGAPIVVFSNTGSAKVATVDGNADATAAAVAATANVTPVGSPDGVKGIGTDAVAATAYYYVGTKSVATVLKTVPVSVAQKYIAVAADNIQKDVTDNQTYAIHGAVKTFVTNYAISAPAGVKFSSGKIASIADGAATTLIEIDNGTVGAVSGDAVKIYGGIVGAVKATGLVTVYGGVIDSITSTCNAAVAPANDVLINGGTINGNVTAVGSIGVYTKTDGLDDNGTVIATKAITIGGNVSAVAAVKDYQATGKASVFINATCNTGKESENALVTVTVKGNVRADYATAGASFVTIGSAAKDTTAAITTGTVTAPVIALLGGGKVTTGSLIPTAENNTADDTTVKSNVTFTDYNSSVAAVTGFDAITVASGTVTVSSAVATNTFTFGAAGTKFTVPALTVNHFVGINDSTLVIPFGKLFIGTGSVTGGRTTLLATGTSAVGTTVFVANPKGLENVFKIDGITVQGNTTNGDGAYNYNVLQAKLTGLTMSQDTATVAKGAAATLSVVANPTAAALASTQSIKWTVPDGSYVSVKGNGGQNLTATITGVDWSQTNFNNNNEVVVTAQIVDTATGVPADAAVATCKVTVTKSNPTVTAPATASVKVGGTADVALSITPAGFSASTATWTSSDESIAKVAVDSKDCSKATITGVKGGTAKVTVVASIDGSSYTKEIVVTVADTTAAFDKTTAVVRAHTQSKIGYGDKNAYATATLTVTGDTTTVPTVASTDATIATATVAKTATAGVYTVVIKGLKAGTASISATVGSVTTTAPIAVTVGKAAAGYLQIDTASYKMAPGGKYEIGCVINGIPTAGVKDLTVTTSRDAVATVTKVSGGYLIKGVKDGTAYISFTYGNTHASVKIDVVTGAKAGGTAVRATSFFD